MVGTYLVVPLVRPLTALPDPRRKGLLHNAITLWLVFTIFLPFIQHFWPGSINPYTRALPDFPSGYLGVFILGFYLHYYGLKIHPILLAVGAILGAGATCLLVYFEQTLRDGSFWAYSNSCCTTCVR